MNEYHANPCLIPPQFYADAAEPARPSPIATELESLHGSIGRIHERIKILSDRLSSALSPEPPVAASVGGAAKPHAAPCRLALQIADSAQGIRDAESALANLIARIQL